MQKQKEVKLEIKKKELKDFLKYFYYVEEIAQGSGNDTGSKWEAGKASEFHDKLLKAEHEFE